MKLSACLHEVARDKAHTSIHMNLLWVGLIAFACLHYPTSVNRERVVAQRELLQAAESALNGGLTPVLNLRTYDLSDGQ